jgi:DNA processing protein
MSNINKLPSSEWPEALLHIPDPPETLYIRGNMPPKDAIMLCVVGARRYTSYGKDVCEKCIATLKGRNVAIVSGLAMGIDTIAHKAALNNDLFALAVPGSGLNDDVMYPNMNKRFAHEILESSGGLISEFEPDFISTMWAFPRRNRIMAGLSKAVLIIEAEKRSGTLITARLATEYNRDVLTVPGNIFSPNSEGPHLLLRLGATPITCPDDLLEALGFERGDDISHERKYEDCTDQEKEVLRLLQDSMSRDELIRKSALSTQDINILVSILELKGYIKEDAGQLHLF